MRDFMVFEEHVLPAWRIAGMSRGPDVWYERPIGYLSNVANILGPRTPLKSQGVQSNSTSSSRSGPSWAAQPGR